MNNTFEINWPDWETVGLIGRGSFGAVYEIQRDVLGDIEKAALKVISVPQNQSDIDELYSDGYDNESISNTFQSHLKSIVAEYTLMKKLKGSPNVVNCDDIKYIPHKDGIGWDIFIKMELLTPLYKALPEQIPESVIIDIAKDLCSALCLCQKHNIVHRDIKPQNIFVSENGDYKLGDFGIAKTVEKTMAGTKIGTYKYMAPEVYNNQPYGASADIYSLGLVLYWLLNEKRMPFLPLPPEKIKVGMEENARARRLAGESLPAPIYGSNGLKSIVLKACAFNPAERYSSAEEMLLALNNVGNCKTEASNAVKSNSSLSNKILNYIVLDFKRKNNVDLLTDEVAVKRILEVVNKNIEQIKQGEEIIFSLPYITATAAGPLHIELKITLDEIMGSSTGVSRFCNMPIREVVAMADRGDTEAMLEIVCLYCIEMHKKCSQIDLVNDSVFKSQLYDKLSKVLDSIKNDKIIFLSNYFQTTGSGMQNVSLDLTWQNARDYMVLTETSFSISAIKGIVDDEMNNAQTMFSKGEFKKAAKHLISALSYDNTRADAWNLLGRCYREMKDYGAAEKSYKRAAALTPDDAIIYNNMAIVYMMLNQLDDARDNVRTAFKKAGMNTSVCAHVWATAASIEAKGGNKKRAKEYYAKAKAAGYENIDKLKMLIESSETDNKNSSDVTKAKLHFDASLICAFILLLVGVLMFFIMPLYGVPWTIVFVIAVIKMIKNRLY